MKKFLTILLFSVLIIQPLASDVFQYVVSATSSWEQTTDKDFSGGILENLKINGTSADAQLELTLRKGDTWTNKTLEESPPPRGNHALVYDSKNDVVVLFGGRGGESYDQLYSDTWIYNPTINRWINRTPAYSPPPSYSHSLAYDSANGLVVLYGIHDFGGAYNDIWIYNVSSNTWVKKDPQNKPPIKYNPTITYDVANGVIVMFAGYTHPGDYSSTETWVYNISNNTWIDMNLPSSPSGRYGHNMVYDSRNGVHVLFGGWDGSDYTNDTWIYNVGSNTWTQKFPTVKPPKRYAQGMTYDSSRGAVVLFGGWGGVGYEDTWTYNVSTNIWLMKKPNVSPSIQPSLYSHTTPIVYDDANDLVVMFGDYPFSETWVYGKYEQYVSSGSYTSQPYFLGGSAVFGTISWSAKTSGSTPIKFQIRTADTKESIGKNEFVGYNGSASAYYTAPFQIWSGHNYSKWIQYRAYLSTTNVIETPVLDSVKINYNLIHNISLLSPNGGENITELYNITWNAMDIDNDSLNFDIFLSSDGGITYPGVLATNLPNDTRLWKWDTTKFQNGTKYRIKIVAHDNSSIPISLSDVSEENFTIQHPSPPPPNRKPTTSLLSPKDGDVISTNSVTLLWNGTDEDNDELLYYVLLDTINGSTVVSLQKAPSYTATDLKNGTYYWTVVPNDGKVNGTCLSGIWKFIVKIQPTNVPPRILDIPDIVLVNGESTSINLLQYAEDEDIFNLSWSISDVNATLISADINGSILTISSVYGEGITEINITATDVYGEKANKIVRIKIIEVKRFSPGDYFVQLSDTHIGGRGADKRLEDIVSAINNFSKKPRFVIVSGDLIDKNGDKKGAEAYQLFVKVMNKLVIPWYAVRGEHDDGKNLTNYYAYIGEHDLNNKVIKYDNLTIIGLDSGDEIHKSGKGKLSESSGFNETQIKWLESVLSVNLAKKKVIILHHPVINYNEKNELDGIVWYNNTDFLNLSEKYSVDLVLSGHTHQYKRYVKNGTVHIQIPSVVEDVAWQNVTLSDDGKNLVTTVENLVPTLIASSGSPIDVYMCDSTGKRAGKDAMELPGTVYLSYGEGVEKTEVVSVYGIEGYKVVVEGTGSGTYLLIIKTNTGTKEVVAKDIPISFGQRHEYTVDWAALAENSPKSVMIATDENGDGIPERIVWQDGMITPEEMKEVKLQPQKPAIPYSWFFVVIVILLCAGAYAAYRVRKRKQMFPSMHKPTEFAVEDVFLIYGSDGRLIQHTTRRIKADMDKDIFASMLTAVQTFIKDSLGKDKKAELGSMEYGENKIILQKGKWVVLAAVISGNEPVGFRDEMKLAINNVEAEYAVVLPAWDGDIGKLAGVERFLTVLGAKKLVEEIVEEKPRVDVQLMSELEFYQGFIRLKVAVKNNSEAVVTNAVVKIIYNEEALRFDYIEPKYAMEGKEIILGNIESKEKKSVAIYLDPQICTESYIDGTLTFKDYKGNLEMTKMKRKKVAVVCPIMYTDENINTAMLKRMVAEELDQRDTKIFAIPSGLTAQKAFEISKRGIRHHDVRLVREFTELEPYVAEAWYFGKTKERKDRLVIRLSVRKKTNSIEFFVASESTLVVTGLLAELKNDLNEELKKEIKEEKPAQQIIDEKIRDEIQSKITLLDKCAEEETAAEDLELKS